MNPAAISSEMQSQKKKAIPPFSPHFLFGVCMCVHAHAYICACIQICIAFSIIG